MEFVEGNLFSDIQSLPDSQLTGNVPSSSFFPNVLTSFVDPSTPRVFILLLQNSPCLNKEAPHHLQVYLHPVSLPPQTLSEVSPLSFNGPNFSLAIFLETTRILSTTL